MRLETKTNKTMKQTIKEIRNYLELNDDWYVSKKLDILEKEIALEITKAELKTITELNNL